MIDHFKLKTSTKYARYNNVKYNQQNDIKFCVKNFTDMSSLFLSLCLHYKLTISSLLIIVL